jgi:hypothetical protein
LLEVDVTNSSYFFDIDTERDHRRLINLIHTTMPKVR